MASSKVRMLCVNVASDTDGGPTAVEQLALLRVGLGGLPACVLARIS